jgi:hypothetical protein
MENVILANGLLFSQSRRVLASAIPLKLPLPFPSGAFLPEG